MIALPRISLDVDSLCCSIPLDGKESGNIRDIHMELTPQFSIRSRAEYDQLIVVLGIIQHDLNEKERERERVRNERTIRLPYDPSDPFVFLR